MKESKINHKPKGSRELRRRLFIPDLCDVCGGKCSWQPRNPANYRHDPRKQRKQKICGDCLYMLEGKILGENGVRAIKEKACQKS